MRLTVLMAMAFSVAGCSSQSIETGMPIGVSSKIDGLQRSPCNCGGIEDKKSNKQREKRKKAAAKAGIQSNDIIREDK